MIGTLWRRLLKKIRARKDLKRTAWPSPEQIAAMPAFDEVRPENIVVITTPEGAERAYKEILESDVVGFDTESKPTFKKGEPSTGPHVAQFATRERTYIFMLHQKGVCQTAGKLIRSAELKKVGFGLGDDLKRIRIKMGVQPHSTVDLETLFTARGFKRGIGVKIAVAITLQKQFKKSKKASTSNWGHPHLTDKQLLYAANDAYAALCVYQALIESKGKGAR